MNERALSWLDWAIVAVYFFGMIWVGGRFRGRQQDSRNYFLGSRPVPGWAVGMSMFATVISSWAFLALPAKAFQSNLEYLMAIAAIPVAAWVAARWIVPLFREKIRLSAYEFLEQRFGRFARAYGNLAFLIVHFGKMAAILYLLCLAIAQMTGWDIYLLIAVVGGSTMVYTFFGGIEGVIWTDVAQGGLLLFAGIAAALFILFQAPDGAAALLAAAWDAGKFRLISPTQSLDRTSTVVLVFFGLNYYLQKYVADQTLVQRYLLAPNNRKAGRALWLSSWLVMGVWALFMGIGALLWAYYNSQPGLLPEAVRATPDRVFPYFIAHELPPGLPGLMLAGLLAATMSTLSSDLNSLSAVVLDDYYRKLRPRASEASHLLFSRLTVLAAGLLGVGLAMAMTRIHSMADAAFDFVSLVGGGLLGMYILGLVSRRCHARAIHVAIACGAVFAVWANFYGSSREAPGFLPRFPMHTLWVGLVSNLIVFTVGYTAGLLSRGGNEVSPDAKGSYDKHN